MEQGVTSSSLLAPFHLWGLVPKIPSTGESGVEWGKQDRKSVTSNTAAHLHWPSKALCCMSGSLQRCCLTKLPVCPVTDSSFKNMQGCLTQSYFVA